MAVNSISAPFIFETGCRIPFSGRALELGRQAIFFDRREAIIAANMCGFKLKEDVPSLPLITYPYSPQKQGLSDVEFFQMLGFDEVDSLDFNDREGNNIIFDLNSSQTPPNLQESYDFVFDVGTLEHVFHTPNFLTNVHNMLKVGGRVFHLAPASNFVGHGFYSLSPCFYIDYYTHNGYDLESVKLLKFDPYHSEYEAWAISLFPGNTDLRRAIAWSGTLDESIYFLIATAHKLPTSTGGAIPIQDYYQESSAALFERPPYEMERNRWILPWEPVPCFDPGKANVYDMQSYKQAKT